MALRAAGLAAALVLAAATASAQAVAQQAAPDVAQSGGAPASPEAQGDGVPASGDTASGDTWIFSGVLGASKETFSGTLITGKDTAFEMKLSGGATCDGDDLQPSIGLVGLSEIACSDGRKMHALFVPQGGETLQVFGHVGDERFKSVAHLLGTQPIPESQQTTEPQAPPPELPATPPARPGAHDPG